MAKEKAPCTSTKSSAAPDSSTIGPPTLVSALTKKLLDDRTFTRTAPNTFDLLHRP